MHIASSDPVTHCDRLLSRKWRSQRVQVCLVGLWVQTVFISARSLNQAHHNSDRIVCVCSKKCISKPACVGNFQEKFRTNDPAQPFSMVLVVALKFSPSLLFSVLRLFPFNDVKQFSVLCIVRIKLCALFSPMWGVVGLCCYSRRVRAKDDLQ